RAAPAAAVVVVATEAPRELAQRAVHVVAAQAEARLSTAGGGRARIVALHRGECRIAERATAGRVRAGLLPDVGAHHEPVAVAVLVGALAIGVVDGRLRAEVVLHRAAAGVLPLEDLLLSLPPLLRARARAGEVPV